MNRLLLNLRVSTTFLAATIVHKENEKNEKIHRNLDGYPNSIFATAIANSSKMIRRRMEECGAPGMVVAVSINGRTVWSQGFGYSDVENDVECHPGTVMRVASISKCFTSVAMAKLWEEGKLDVDKPIHDYLPDYPPMKYKGKEVRVTLKHLLCHVGGVRHYNKEDVPDDKSKKENESEIYSTKHYTTVTEGLELFKDDPLINHPDENKFGYSSHAWTLVSAVLEKASGKTFLRLMNDTFHSLGMKHTKPDLNNPIIYGRSRYYERKDGRLFNSPYVDLSYKWSGGGFLSTVGDLLKFADAVMYCYNVKNTNYLPGFLRKDTVEKLWSSFSVPQRSEMSSDPEYMRYGLGWYVCPGQEGRGNCPNHQLEVAHTGGSVGASSIILLLPDAKIDLPNSCPPSSADYKSDGVRSDAPMQGMSVAIITNIGKANLTPLARNISQQFLR
uniref:serine beta-lactamase-like protein LACTB, mitochondrial isoform X1 n=2 Tax=Ciona intestinalis TaxID=7719 RepID=UPI000052209C|nr:serine beta-lactamase-like protein LACTB, mitochondrial isoform X1 [Ciona intestinalis]|eukprot:XP_002131852.1 serine beta-lactamase-like protein LACTB, mitochondrial isoform X1 [Ciona intestinalis]